MSIVISEGKDAARRAVATAKADTLIEALPWLDRVHGAPVDYGAVCLSPHHASRLSPKT